MDNSQVEELVVELEHKPQKFYRLCGAPTLVESKVGTCPERAEWKLWPSGWREQAIYRCLVHLAGAIDASPWQRIVLEREAQEEDK